MAQDKKQGVQPTGAQQQPAEKAQFPLQTINFILIAVCIVIIAIGFILMAGSANTGETWNADIFSTRRTVVGPTVALLGFVLMIPAIMWRGKKGGK